jgi:hypothetical protein
VPCSWFRVSQNSIRTTYRHPEMSSEQARHARALALRFVLDCYAKKKGGCGTAQDARKEFNGSRKTIVSK